MAKNIGAVRIVVSAVNFTEGGPLTVLRECLAAAADVLPKEWELVALVHRADLLTEPRARLIPIPSSKRSWLHRMYWEWFGFRRISNDLRPALWLSLHDMTPRVCAMRQAVYCHNPAPFYRVRAREALFEPKLLLFNLFYLWLYRLFITRNRYIIVQQGWLRTEFRRRFGPLPVVVAHPSPNVIHSSAPAAPGPDNVFLYPALPRAFKNFETLCEAAKLLTARGIRGFEVRLTVSGNENRYAAWLRGRYGSLPGVRFIGRQSKDDMVDQYRRALAVVFPSKLETWGLPISEGKAHRRPLLLADLPYAREAVGNYDLVSFFPADSAVVLADLMQSMLEGAWKPVGGHEPAPSAPFAANWASLWHLLIEDLPEAPSSGPAQAT